MCILILCNSVYVLLMAFRSFAARQLHIKLPCLARITNFNLVAPYDDIMLLPCFAKASDLK